MPPLTMTMLQRLERQSLCRAGRLCRRGKVHPASARRRARTAARRAALLVSLLVVAAAAGCEPARPVVPKASPPVPTRATALVARWLPAETGWIVLAPNAAALVRQWLPDEAAAARRRLTLESLRSVEEDLLSAEGLGRLGLDPEGLIGAAAVGPGGRATVWLAAVADRVALVRGALRWWRGRDVEVATELVDRDWFLLTPDDGEVAMVVSPTLALLVVDDGVESAAKLARELALLDAPASLGATEPFATLERELPAGDLWAFVELGAMARAALGLEADLAGATAAEAAAALEDEWRIALDRAAREGQRADEMVALDESFRTRRRAIRDDGEARRSRHWVGPTGPLGLSADLRPNGLRLQGLWLMAAGSPLSSLLDRAPPGTSLATALPRRPRLLVQAALDADRSRHLVEWLAGLAMGHDELLAETGPAAGVLAAWDGTFGVALLAEEPAEPDAVTAGAVIGARSLAPVETALERWADAAGQSPIRRGAEPGRYQIELGGFGAVLRVARDRILAATSEPLLGAIGEAPPTEPPWSGAGHAMIRDMAGGAGAPALFGVLDLSLLAPGALPLGDEGDRAKKMPAAAGPADAGEQAAAAISSPGGDPALGAERIARRMAAIDALWQRDPLRQLAADGGVVALGLTAAPRGVALDLRWVSASPSVAGMLERVLAELIGAGTGGRATNEARAAEYLELGDELVRLEKLAAQPPVVTPPPDPPVAAADAGVGLDASAP